MPKIELEIQENDIIKLDFTKDKTYKESQANWVGFSNWEIKDTVNGSTLLSHSQADSIIKDRSKASLYGFSSEVINLKNKFGINNR